MEKRVASRRPAGTSEAFQRGDVVEPPPVFDVEVDHPEDRAEVRGILARRCGTHPVWEMPATSEETAERETPAIEGDERESSTTGAGPASPPDGNREIHRRRERSWARRLVERAVTVTTTTSFASGTPEEETREPNREEASPREAEDDLPHATTDELYELIEELVDRGFTWPEQPEPELQHKPPPEPRFARLRSLLWLRRCTYEVMRKDVSGEEITGGDVLENNSKTQIRVITELRRVRWEHGEEQRVQCLKDLDAAQQEDDPEQVTRARRALSRATSLVRWRRLAYEVSRFSSRIALAASKASFGKFDERLLTPIAFVVSVVTTAVPFAFLGLFAQWVDNLIGVLVGSVLAVAYLVLGFFLLLPWRPYTWLNQHKYLGSPPPSGGGKQSTDDHRSRGIHVLNRLHADAETEGRIRPGEFPPRVHRLAVNAFLDDLHKTYGSSGRAPLLLRRRRHRRPVLVFEQERLDRVARYLVLLIEEERLRRGFPDPLLLVQVRSQGSTPLVDEHVDIGRYLNLPEAENHEPEVPTVHWWTRARHAAGVLGTRRLISERVREVPDVSGELVEPTWVLTGPALAKRWAGGVGAAATVLVVLGTLVVPGQVQNLFECVQEGVTVPQGITTVGEAGQRECIGVTFGDFVFHERLEEVVGLIREQNEQVDEGDHLYVTVAHFAEMSLNDPNDPSLSGVQGELLGLAYRQQQHNNAVSGGAPKIKLLLANAGQQWRHAPRVAEQIVELAEDTSLGMDRPVGGVGFGHSVVPNSQAIQIMGDAHLPMVGTTTTFDDVAGYGDRRHHEYFFPVAASNSRIAAQTAYWARNGVPWTDAEGEPWTDEQGEQRSLSPADTAVAIAGADAADAEEDYEQYGPDLAERFMEEFRALGGAEWEGTEGLGSDEYANGTLLYRSGDLAEDTTFEDHLDRICAGEEEPPDLIFFAGRTNDFAAFHEYLRSSGGDACVRGEIDILAGDDIAKYVTDHEEVIGDGGRHPVYYTPLAARGAWGSESEGQAFFDAMDREVEELYLDPDNVDPEKVGEDGEVDVEWLPSIAHAAVGHDALFVLSRAMPHSRLELEEQTTRPPYLGLFGAPPFLSEDEDVEEYRSLLLGGIRNTDKLSGMSGAIRFDEGTDGQWFPHRMVQLVLVGPELDGNYQHVIAACGQLTADPPPATADCP